MRNRRIALMAALAIFASPWALALENPASQPNPNDPSVSEVYAAARAGHLDQAREMMQKVLANHPQSARAHYVAAELDADLKNFGEARQELATAERLAPGLPSVDAASVAALRRQIGMAAPAAPAAGGVVVRPQVYHASRPFPWSTILIIGAVGLIAWALLRRRPQPMSYNNPYSGTPGAPMGPGMGPGPMVPPGSGFPNVVGGGVGSGIVGGIASGLAVGAGVAAGEELIHRAFDRGGTVPAGERVEEYQPPPDPNPDLGGPDFGISDGAGWDDGGGSSGGDDGSWT